MVLPRAFAWLLPLRRTGPVALLFGLLLAADAQATSWGINHFADSVYWSDAIVVGKITAVKPRQAGSEIGRASCRERV